MDARRALKPLGQYTTEELYAHFHFGNADTVYTLSGQEQGLIALCFYGFYHIAGDNIGVDISAERCSENCVSCLINHFV